MRLLRIFGSALAAIGISLAATVLLVILQPDRAITLLIYLPGIAIVDALFGFWGGVFSVLLSVAGSASYRIWFFPSQVQQPFDTFYSTWEEELILLLVGLFVVVLTELRRRSGARARVGAHQLAALLEHVGDAVLVFDRNSRMISMNPAAHAMLQRPGQTLVGQTATQLRERFQFIGERPHPELEDLLQSGANAREEGTVLDVEMDRRIQVLVSTSPWRGVDDHVEGAIVMVTDVTALKNVQLHALDNARHLAVAEMISGLSHDFNHVLDIVRRSVAVLEMIESAPAAERRKYREMIDRAAIEGGQIVRRLRDYLAGGAARQTEVDLAEVAGDAVELTRPLWRNRTSLAVIEDLAPVPLVRGSANDLQRVLVNLLFNAVEAIGPASGRITIRTRPGTGPQATACVEVEDTGPGVSADAEKKLFQPYVTTKPHGMGLGLFGARKIAQAHEGSLRYASKSGRGARFVLEIPAATEPSAPAAEPPEREIA